MNPHAASIRQVVLVGLPGAGKTSTGRLLAGRLGLPFFDVDQVIEAAEGRSISQIFADAGEATFRAMEESETIRLLDGNGVISLGGGAVENSAIRAALAGRCVVWLDESVAEGARRIDSSTHRPLMVDGAADRLKQLSARREPLYRQVATIRADTDGKSVAEVAEELAATLAHSSSDNSDN